MKWRVGNGSNIKVWLDSWLPGNVIPPHTSSFDPDLRFSDCIDHQCGEWRLDILQTLFSPDWASQEQDASNVVGNEVWRVVWSLDGPPKLSHFVWKACKGSLAVKGELFRRHIAADPICSGCSVTAESISHALFCCAGVQNVWGYFNCDEIISDSPLDAPFHEWLLWMANKVDRVELRRILTIAWAIWFCRNKRVYENVAADLFSCGTGYIKLVQDYRNYAGKVFKAPTCIISAATSRWVKPVAGVTKINVDAHVGLGASGGFGVVARDSQGQILWAATKKIPANWAVEDAEACSSY
ncbi:uncharacterized protein LOC110698830 [Chenopodium quinoa]|uniref:uncharacterized protein LOC110698830 n=1 Tax=Chenopodium quinoa TaxID=63459 RepID=UPI000B78FB0E|nr:uncharacterized protein LOC110698830 [Chenopodium quinoa]